MEAILHAYKIVCTFHIVHALIYLKIYQHF